MALNLSKINHEVVGRLRGLSSMSFNNGDYLSSFLLNILFLEGTVNYIILDKIVKKENVDTLTFEKFRKGQNFSTSIDFFYLLTDDIERYKKLKVFNQKRNKIIHALFSYPNFDQILQESRTIANETKELELELLGLYLTKETEDSKSNLEQKNK